MIRTASIEEKLRDRKYRRIGWAIMHMGYWERLWWALGGKHKYMTTEFWEKKHD